MSVKFESKLGSFLRIEIKGLDRLQTVQAVNTSTYSHKDGFEANFACGLPQVPTKLAVLLIGGLELAPGSGIAKID